MGDGAAATAATETTEPVQTELPGTETELAAAIAAATETQQGEQTAGEEGAQAKADEAVAPAIEVTLPEGVSPDPTLMEALKGAAKDSASAQALANAFVAHQQATEAKAKEEWTATQQTWADQLKADPDVGGARYDASAAAAEKAMTRYADADLRKLLEDTGLRNHPSMFRMFVRAGQALSEDSVTGTGGAPAARRTMEDVHRTHYHTMFKDKE